MIPIFVCAPSHSNIIDRDEGFPVKHPSRSYPIGMLLGLDAEEKDVAEYEVVEEELKSKGLSPRYYVQRVAADDGKYGCLLSFAVEVRSYEEAERLPGFVPLGEWHGSYHIPPELFSGE